MSRHLEGCQSISVDVVEVPLHVYALVLHFYT